MNSSYTPPDISTETLAAQFHVKPGSIRVRFCRTGSYFGLIPKKLPNGRLSWPGDSYERLTNAARKG
ncbi:DNA-binding protein [Candidatus Falkowbacteria bacterium]|jgi:hypothetical protein|nr:DNA-binding protein [Candidatus Falkowbacteria bacterium]